MASQDWQPTFDGSGSGGSGLDAPAVEADESVEALEMADPAYLPPEARLILSALAAGESPPSQNRRGGARTMYQVRAALRLFSDPEGSAAWKLYTRDVSSRSLGFLTPHRLPLGYGGIVELPGPDGTSIRAHCTLFRCRQTVRGWYEGALSFHRPQWNLSGESPDKGAGE